jgi:hypothetical protein
MEQLTLTDHFIVDQCEDFDNDVPPPQEDRLHQGRSEAVMPCRGS